MNGKRIEMKDLPNKVSNHYLRTNEQYENLLKYIKVDKSI